MCRPYMIFGIIRKATKRTNKMFWLFDACVPSTTNIHGFTKFVEGQATDLQVAPDGVNVAVQQSGVTDVQPTISGTSRKTCP